MTEHLRTYLIELLTRKAPLPPGVNLDTFLYLDAGQIDSLSLIKFIVEIEERFGIEFTPEDTQSTRFRTVGGLEGLIVEKMNGRNS